MVKELLQRKSLRITFFGFNKHVTVLFVLHLLCIHKDLSA